jgi:hypothetical protein
MPRIGYSGLAGAYIDVHSEALNSALTPGNMVRITGSKIKIEGEESACGVWFVNQADSSRTKITEYLAVNRGAELVGVIPPLAAGTYRLEVVTKYTHGTAPLKEARTIVAEPVLTVS